jgi:RNA polymerase sigma factor (TIGR02999 family)
MGNRASKPDVLMSTDPVESDVMADITQLLEAAEAGDRQAAADLLPLVYDELRKLATARLASEKPGHTLDPTALVHEAYLRLVGDQNFDGRRHFFAAAAEAMRRVLVNHARDRGRLKRGGVGRSRIDLDHLTGLASASDDDLIDLDAALERLAGEFPDVAELVKLRFFVGMTQGAAAEALGLPRRTADRQWAFARAWLAEALGGGHNHGEHRDHREGKKIRFKREEGTNDC